VGADVDGGLKKELIGGLHLSMGEKERGLTPSGFARVGRGLPPGLGQNGSPRPFSIFIYFLLFFFSVFYLFISFVFWFQIKSNQLAKNYLKFQLLMQDSKGYVLMIKLVFKKTLLIDKNGFICIMQNRIRVFKIIL
jgi:hypothetical protein